MKRVLITGSNRGLGLEFTRQCLEAGWRVYATCKRPAEAQSLKLLMALHNGLSVHRLDVTVQEDICNIVEELEHIKLDILINSASVRFKKKTESIEQGVHYETWRRTLEVNTLGSIRVVEALLENIASSKDDRGIIVTISSNIGPIDNKQELPGSIYYRSSKAALNTAMNEIAMELRSKGIGVLLMDPGPGSVGTRKKECISTQKSVQGMLRIINNFSMDTTGSFFHYDGRQIPW